MDGGGERERERGRGGGSLISAISVEDGRGGGDRETPRNKETEMKAESNSSVNGFRQENKAKTNVISNLSNLIA